MSTWSLFSDGSTLTPLRSAESNFVHHRGQGKRWFRMKDNRIIWQPGGCVEFRNGIELRYPVRTSNSFWGRLPSSQSFADDGSDLIFVFPGKLLRLISAADATVADAQRPIIQQIPANRDFVAAVMIEVVVVGFQCNREQVFHAARNSLVPFAES
jgi:hypothetical protein